MKHYKKVGLQCDVEIDVYSKFKEFLRSKHIPISLWVAIKIYETVGEKYESYAEIIKKQAEELTKTIA